MKKKTKKQVINLVFRAAHLYYYCKLVEKYSKMLFYRVYEIYAGKYLNKMTKQEFEFLFRKYHIKMYHLALTILYDEEESKDVVSDVFTTILDRNLDIDADRAEGYLLISVRNRCRNIIANKSTRERLLHLFLVEVNHPLSVSDDYSRLEELMNYIDTDLPLLSKKIFRMRYLREMSYKEISDELNISKVTVYNHLSKSLEKISEHFNKSK